MQDILAHTGKGHDDNPPGRGSGRFPWGFGDNPGQHSTSTVDRFRRLKEKGVPEKDILKSMFPEASEAELKSRKTEIRDYKKLESIQRKAAMRERALYLYTQKNMKPETISKKIGKPASTVRDWINKWDQTKMAQFENLANEVRKEILKRKYVDIGEGTERRLKVSAETLRAVKTLLVNDWGFNYYTLEAGMPGNNHTRTVKVLCAPGITFQDLIANKSKVDLFGGYTVNEDVGIMGIKPPVSIDSKRIAVAYDSPKDGTVEIKRGVPDLQLGKASYAQVRIAVDGTHYIKGVAMYMDEATAKKLPPGVDLIVNSNKKEGTPLISNDPNGKQVLKPFEIDKAESLIKGKPVINESNPFGSALKTPDQLILAQAYYDDPKTGEKKQSAINIVNEQGDWDEWNREIASQVLSKQAPALAKRQLDLLYTDQKLEFEKLKQLNNPIVKEAFLNRFADECDSKAVSLKAAGLPRQSSKLLLPFNEVKPHECVVPTLENGTQVVLIRYPHEGKFQIAELTVNNNHPKARKTMGLGTDAVGINPKTASILSGADFDGDTVLVIPVNDKIHFDRIDPNISPELKALKDFDTKIYKVEGRTGDDEKDKALGLPVRPTKEERSRNMGVATNLITDMSVTGDPSFDEYARATKYAMVVIDSYKHDLDWRQARKDFGIAELHRKYQGKSTGGASTIFSRAGREKDYPEREEKKKSMLTPEELERWKNGEKIYEETGKTRTYTDKNGKTVTKQVTMKIEELAYNTDPYKLTSGGSKENPGTRIEALYASHSARMKALANEARKEARSIETPHINRSAAKVYADEVASLNAKLERLQKNRPLERIASLIATENYNAQVNAAGKTNLDKDDKKKLRDRATKAARMRVAKETYTPEFTAKEWEAIQAQAYSADSARKLITAADNKYMRELAMPNKQRKTLTNAEKINIRAKLRAGYTAAEVAKLFGVSVSTISKVANDKQ